MPRSLIAFVGAGLLLAVVVLGGQRAGLWLQPDTATLPSTATPMANRPGGPEPIQPSLSDQNTGATNATQPAQESGGQAATRGRLPPSEMGGDRGTGLPGTTTAAPGATNQPPADTGIQRQQPPRTAPPPGHVTLGAPPVQGPVEQPGSTGTFNAPGSPIPERPAQPSTGPRDTPVERSTR
jgi:hypothetical protein